MVDKPMLPLTADDVASLLQRFGAPRPWNAKRIDGFVSFLRSELASAYLAPVKLDRDAEPSDDLDRARDAIAVLRRVLPGLRVITRPLYRMGKIEDLRDKMNVVEYWRQWQEKCDRLEASLFEIGPRVRPHPGWHFWAAEFARAYASIVGEKAVSKTGPALRFIRYFLVAAFNHNPSASTIETNVNAMKADTGWWLLQQVTFDRLLDQLGGTQETAPGIFQDDSPPE